MKLAIISPLFLPVPDVKGGAIEKLITFILEANEKKHLYDIDLYTLDDSLLAGVKYNYTNLITIKPKSEYNLLTHGYYSIRDKIGFSLDLNPKFLYTCSMIRKVYKKNYYDAVLVENNMDVFLALLPKITKEKMFFHLHNDFGNGDKAKTVDKAKAVAKNADKIIVVSHFLKNKFEQIGVENVEVVPNAIIANDFNPVSIDERKKIREQYNIKKNDFVFLFVGRVSKEKGTDKVISAFSNFKSSNVRLFIAGDSSLEQNNYASNLIKQYAKLGDKLKFLGYVKNDDMRKLYSISDCVIVPTQIEEAFGMVVLEAMRMHVPVIATKSGGISEVLGNTGFLLSKNKDFTNNLYKKMECLFKSTDKKREQIGMVEYKRSQEFPMTELKYYNLITKILLK